METKQRRLDILLEKEAEFQKLNKTILPVPQISEPVVVEVFHNLFIPF